MADPVLYLSQSYSDAWADYLRSCKSMSFPTWDYVILTASNEHQAEGFKAQIIARKSMLPQRTQFVVIPDENGMRVGSGGATLAVIKYLREKENSFSGRIPFASRSAVSFITARVSAFGLG